MLKITLYNQQGEKVGEEKLNESIFSVKINPALIHQVVVGMLANLRQPLAHTKIRSEVRGGGRKPWRQKGTGRARHGSIRSPLWIGGGIAFGPRKERSYEVKINKKARRKAILMALSDKVANQRFILLDNLEINEPKTKKMHQMLSGLVKKAILDNATPRVKETAKSKKEKSTPNAKKIKAPKLLIILGSKDEARDRKILRSSRNLPYANITRFNSLNLLDLLKDNYIITEAKTVKEIEKLFAKK